MEVKQIDRLYLLKLVCTGHSKTSIAEMLGIDRKTLYRYLKKYPLSDDDLNKISFSTQPVQNLKEETQLEHEFDKSKSDEGLPENWQQMSPKERREYLDKNILDGDMQKILK